MLFQGENSLFNKIGSWQFFRRGRNWPNSVLSAPKCCTQRYRVSYYICSPQTRLFLQGMFAALANQTSKLARWQRQNCVQFRRAALSANDPGKQKRGLCYQHGGDAPYGSRQGNYNLQSSVNLPVYPAHLQHKHVARRIDHYCDWRRCLSDWSATQNKRGILCPSLCALRNAYNSARDEFMIVHILYLTPEHRCYCRLSFCSFGGNQEDRLREHPFGDQRSRSYFLQSEKYVE